MLYFDTSFLIPLLLPEKTSEQIAPCVISKDVVRNPLTPFTLRRIEQLRRTVLETLIKIKGLDRRGRKKAFR